MLFSCQENIFFPFELINFLQVILQLALCCILLHDFRKLSCIILLNFKIGSFFLLNEWFARRTCGRGWSTACMICVFMCASFLKLMPWSIDAISCCLVVFYIPVLVFCRLLQIHVYSMYSLSEWRRWCVRKIKYFWKCRKRISHRYVHG